VNSDGRTTMAACLGVLMVKLVTGGGYLAYVRPRMGLALLLAGACLMGVGAVALLPSLRSALPRRAETAKSAHRLSPMGDGRALGDPGHGPPDQDLAEGFQGHSYGRRLELLLLVPIVLIAVVPPLPLGAAAAAMKAGTQRAPSTSGFRPLPPAVTGAVPLTVSEFVTRALYDTDGSLRGIRVRLVGLAAREAGAPPGGFLLVRFAMFCCAADAIPVRIRIRRSQSRSPPEDSWVEVMGTWRPSPPHAGISFDPSMMPTLDALAVRAVPEPSDPYDPPF
jgi:uncharacterized repeat protein (TIGR03943 family)